ncbi:RDD family protein [Nocardiopsis synnemataformans]|uniref:RDD family protein n=1 Tax=Nocardiopsis synnemataformans TaxID=61305 RepID=UPI003EC11D1C
MQPPYQPSGAPAENEPPRQYPGNDGRSVPPTPYAPVGWQDPAARPGGQPGMQPGFPTGAQPGFQPPAVPAYPAPSQGLPHQYPHAHGQQGYYPHPQNWLPQVITDPGQWSPHNPEVGRAEMGVRFVARLLDTFFVGCLWYAMMMLGAVVSLIIGGGDMDGGAGEIAFMVTAFFNFFLLAIVVEWLQVRLWGRSVGKILLGLWVVRSDGGGRVRAGRAFVRALLYAPGVNPVNLLLPWSLTNVLWPLRDKRLRQCLHDKAAGTVVVQVRR